MVWYECPLSYFSVPVNSINVWGYHFFYADVNVIQLALSSKPAGNVLLTSDKHSSKFLVLKIILHYPFKRETHKMVKHSNNSSANCRRIIWVCLTIMWGWHLKGYYLKFYNSVLFNKSSFFRCTIKCLQYQIS